MDKKLVIALVNSLIERKFKAIDDIRGERGSRGLRGFKGPRGEDGKSFVFEENEQEIKELISSHIQSIKKDLLLKFKDLTQEEKDQLKITLEDFTESEISQLRGPRGQRGREGRSIFWDDIQDNVYEQVKTLYSENIDELKLKFSDLTENEKNTLRLKFNQLTDENKSELIGEKGERGARGLRGQKGRQGEQGLKGDTGPKGDVGPRGAIGLQGLMGQRGDQGEKGLDGLDGLDAPKIIQVKIKRSNNKIKFIFVFDNGEESETQYTELPSLSTIIQQNIISSSGGDGTGGGSLEFFDNGVSLGSFEKLDFLDGEVEVDPVDPTKLNVSLGSNFCLPILDEGNQVTSCATEIDFIGDGVQVVPQQVIADWPLLSDVDIMATFGGDPNKVQVLIDNTATSVATINDNTFTEIKVITALEDTSKQLVLEQTPTDGQKVIIDIVGGTSQVFGTDFIVTGNVLDWNGYGMETIIDENDIIRINYVI